MGGEWVARWGRGSRECAPVDPVEPRTTMFRSAGFVGLQTALSTEHRGRRFCGRDHERRTLRAGLDCESLTVVGHFRRSTRPTAIQSLEVRKTTSAPASTTATWTATAGRAKQTSPGAFRG